jgi:hypothetical protein
MQLHQYEYITMNLVPHGYYIHTCWIFYYICMGNPYSRDLLEKLTAAMLVKNFLRFMVLQLLHSHERTTFPYPNTMNSVNAISSHFFKTHFNIIPPSSCSLLKHHLHFSCHSYMPQSPSTSTFCI